MAHVSEDGFTLAELGVAVTIIGLLLIIATPVFLGSSRRAQDRAAQTTIRHALSIAKSLVAAGTDLADADAATIAAAEQGMRFVPAPAPSDGPNVVSVRAGIPWVATALSRSGTCYAITDSELGGTRYASATLGPCEASQSWAVTASGSSW